MVYETVIDRKLLYRLYSLNRFAKTGIVGVILCIRLLLSVIRAETDSIFLIVSTVLILWGITEIIVALIGRKREAVKVLEKNHITQFCQQIIFEEDNIKIKNMLNQKEFEIPYGEIKKVRKKKYLLVFRTKDAHIFVLDKWQMSIKQQDQLLWIIQKKMPWLRMKGLA